MASSQTASTLSRVTVQYGQQLRPYLEFLNFKAINVGAEHSSYDAGVLTVEKRFAQGLELLLGYNRSKAIDNVGEQTSVEGSMSGFQDNYCYASGRFPIRTSRTRCAWRCAMSCRSGRQGNPEGRRRSKSLWRLVNRRLLHGGCGTSVGRYLTQQ
jgi:hypothetical protein